MEFRFKFSLLGFFSSHAPHVVELEPSNASTFQPLITSSIACSWATILSSPRLSQSPSSGPSLVPPAVHRSWHCRRALLLELTWPGLCFAPSFLIALETKQKVFETPLILYCGSLPRPPLSCYSWNIADIFQPLPPDGCSCSMEASPFFTALESQSRSHDSTDICPIPLLNYLTYTSLSGLLILSTIFVFSAIVITCDIIIFI